MKFGVSLVAGVFLLLGSVVFAADATGVSGDYVEVRTADIYTGPCVANGEVNLAGKEAILAWKVRSGGINGVDLRDLSVVAIVRASATLGDPFADLHPAKAVLVFDEKASTDQKAALRELARSMAGDLLEDVVRQEVAPIEMSLGHHGEASLRAGSIAEIETRSLHEGDHLCGNEIIYYPPLVEVDAVPAYTKAHRFQGEGLNATWSSPFKRSAFVGHFSR